MAWISILTGSRAGETISLDETNYVIGSDDGATIPCVDPDVEWSHARIYYDRERYWIEDLQSRGGVRVNERPVLHRSLREGDAVTVGSVELRFTLDGEPPGAAATKPAVAKRAAEEPERREPTADDGGDGDGDGDGNGNGNGNGDGDGNGDNGDESTTPEPEPWAPPDLAEAETASSGDGDPRGSDSTESMVAAVTAAGEAAAVAGETPDEAAGAKRTVAQREPAVPATQTATAPPATATAPPETDLAGLTAENEALRARIALLERRLQRKQTGLNLATESFVEQLELAKERIQVFAKRYGESEDRARKQAEEIAHLQAENAEIAAAGQSRADELTGKLEAVRHDFEEIERVLRRKAQGYAKMVSEARNVRQHVALSGAPAAPGAAEGSAQAAAAEGGRRPPRASGLQPVAVVLEDGAAEDADAADAPPREDGRLALEQEEDEGGSPRDRRRGPRMRLATVASIFVLLFCFAFMLLLLIKGRSRSGVRSAAAIPELSPERPAASGARFPAAKATPRERATPKAAPTPRPKKAAPKKAAPKAAPKAGVPAPGSVADLIAALRAAHRSRDRARISQEEKALISKGSSILVPVRAAYQKEKQFQLKVSLQYVMLALEGGGGAQTVIDRMRATRDAGEKMRLAFMLLKLSDEDLPAIETALGSEQDPMIRKYLIRALGGLSSGKGVQTLAQVARQGTDRQQRIEAIRALERQRSPEVATLLVDLSTAEQGRDAQIRSIAVRALANVAGRDQSQFFGGVLQQDERTNNRAEAARFFGRVGSAEDLPMLEGALQQERIYYIRQKIEKAVKQIKKRTGSS